jgi:hypothetical protein
MTFPPRPLTQEAEVLISRLNDGYRKIEEAEAAGKDTAYLNQFWIELLTDYMRVVDQLDYQKHAATQTGLFD